MFLHKYDLLALVYELCTLDSSMSKIKWFLVSNTYTYEVSNMERS